VVLARDEKTLGSLALPPVEQILAFGTRNQELVGLLRKYGAEYPAKKALSEEYVNSDSMALDDFGKVYGNQAAVLIEYVRRGDLLKQDVTLGDLALYIFGSGSSQAMFHKLKVLPDVPLWTDDYSDVLRVMMLKEVQWVRKKLGLPTPVGGDDD
jgi:hypothetical protein